jgi:hypothetical protein
VWLGGDPLHLRNDTPIEDEFHPYCKHCAEEAEYESEYETRCSDNCEHNCERCATEEEEDWDAINAKLIKDDFGPNASKTYKDDLFEEDDE